MLKKVKKMWRRFLCRKTQKFSYIDFSGEDTFFLLYEVFVFGDVAACRIVKDIKKSGEFVHTQTSFQRVPTEYALDILRRVKEANQTRDLGFGGFPEF